MKIRTQLTALFIIIVTLLIVSFSFYIYIFSANYRYDEFNNRLLNRATYYVKLLIEVDEVDAGVLRKMDETTPPSLPNEKIIIFNDYNRILYSSDEGRVINFDSLLLDRIRIEKRVTFSENGWEFLGMSYTDEVEDFVAIIAAEDRFGHRKQLYLKQVLALGSLFSIVFVSVVGWLFAGQALSPIKKVVQNVEQITASNLNLRLDAGAGNDEIALLVKTFNNMLTRLEKAFTTQKHFIANASHELRTPLTAISGQLDVLLMKERTEAEYRATISSVFEDIRKLSQTSNKLLLMAQADNEKASIPMYEIRIDEMLWEAQTEINKRARDFKVLFRFETETLENAQFTVLGNEALLITCFTNIMDNACKYSHNHTVTILINNIENHVVIKFSDMGIGIAPDDLDHIFEPFYRSQSVIGYKGHGIGMSLVKRIIDLHKANILIESEIGKGTEVTLSFNLYNA